MPKSTIQKQAEELKARIKRHAGRHDENFRVGVEIELCLIDGRARPVSAKPLIEALSARHQVDYEYGESQLEFKTDPVSMRDIESLNIQLEDFIGDLDRAIKKIDSDVIPVLFGANPSPYILQGLITDKPRYRRLQRWQAKIPDVEIEGIKFAAPQVATAIQGFHMHLQGRDPGFTAQMFNHILNLIPTVILLGANSRLFAGRLFSLHEPRIFMYDQSEQQASGFPAISRYLSGIEDYIDYVISRKPVVAKDYFGLVKERHDDARIRLNTGAYRVETRVMSVQPTPATMMAMIEFFAGYLQMALHTERELRPLAALREERQSVVRSGFAAKSHFSVIETARSQLVFAREGLGDLGIKPAFLGILESRLEKKTTAGEYIAYLWQSKHDGTDSEKAVVEVAADVWERTRHNRAIA
ncbi:MAG: glutamate-cysteine ligase family protein [Nitrososphaera sp.]|jgi:gamma-glutamyl:cysteine ligase YbdK (ATP-grasp superfamily)